MFTGVFIRSLRQIENIAKVKDGEKIWEVCDDIK